MEMVVVGVFGITAYYYTDVHTIRDNLHIGSFNFK